MSNRRREWYLMHYTPPVDMGFEPVLLLTSPEGSTREIELSELSAFEHPLVTHSFGFLVDWFRKLSLALPQEVIDIQVAKRLLIGRPKSDFAGGVPPWDMSATMLPYLPPEYDRADVKRALSTHLARPTEGALRDFRWMRTASSALPRVWRDVERELSAVGESERLTSVEVPAYNAMLETQYIGIRVDATRRDDLLSQVENEYLASFRSLSVDQHVHVDRALHDASYLSECLHLPTIRFMTPQEVIGRFRDSEPVCALLHSILSAKRTKTILLRTLPTNQEFCYPVFDTMGTVTGRILAADPQLQHLKRAYRSALIPRHGTNHVYIDYSQFEPSIIASMSQDTNLLGLCNAGDMYSELAQRLFENPSLRDEAKTLFLSYSYGMSKKAIEAVAAKAMGEHPSRVSRVLENRFYVPFAGVQVWVESIHEQLCASGRVGTAFGNHRNRSRQGRLDSREKRWAISQVVQGTGALILKRLISSIFKHLPGARILLPMHDALLVEMSAHDVTEVTRQLVAEFMVAFSETCPGVQPRVTIGSFAH